MCCYQSFVSFPICRRHDAQHNLMPNTSSIPVGTSTPYGTHILFYAWFDSGLRILLELRNLILKLHEYLTHLFDAFIG